MTRPRIKVGIITGAVVAMSSGALFALPASASPICTGTSGPIVCVGTAHGPGYSGGQVYEVTEPGDVNPTGAGVLCSTSGLEVGVVVNGAQVVDRTVPASGLPC